MSDEPPYDEDELAQAAQLARALERGHAPPSEVDDAIDAASVVRMLNAPVLSDERLNAVLASGEQRVADARRRSRARLAVLGTATGVLALAAAALLMVWPERREPSARAPVAESPSAPSAAAVPAPVEVPAGGAPAAGEALRQAQIAWLEAPTADARERIERALDTYRGEQLAELERRYAR